MKPGFIDAHCHLNALSQPALCQTEAAEQGICGFVVPSTEADSWADVLALSSSNIAVALGTHPWFVKDADTEASLLRQAITPQMAAVGEIGLDYATSKNQPRPERALQRDSFRQQLNIAVENQLPVIIHSVRAHADVLADLKAAHSRCGVIHSFIGSTEQAQAFVDQGFCLGVGPSALNSTKTSRALAEIPLASLMIETDAPFGRLNRSMNNPLLALLAVAKWVAEQKQLPLDLVRQQTSQNAQQLFFK